MPNAAKTPPGEALVGELAEIENRESKIENS